MTEPTPTLVTIPGVHICEVGEDWQISTGPFTIEPDDIAKFIAGVDNDPAVHAPRLRFGHTDDWPVASEPAFGRFINLRAEDNGNVLVADLAGVPAWFADIAPAAWPTRSMDAWEDARTHTGNEYPLLIEAVSFMGVTMPGIGTLEDLAAVWSETPPEGTKIEAGTPIHATRGGGMPKPVAGAVGTQDLNRAFYEDFAEGDRYWWWIRQTYLDPAMLIVDDDEGSLWAVTYSISASGEIEFEEPKEVIIQYVYADGGKVAANALPPTSKQDGGQPTPAAVYVNAADSRPQNRKKEDDVEASTTLDVPRETLIKRLGLPDDATDEAINEALEAEPEQPEEESSEDNDEDENDDTSEEESDDEPAEEDEGGESAEASTRTVPTKEWEDTQRRLKAHDEKAKRDESKRRDGVVNAAVKDGRIARSRAKAWRTKFEADPEGTEELLTASEDKGGLPTNMVPVQEQGAGNGDEVSGSATDAVQDAWYEGSFPELARAGKE